MRTHGSPTFETPSTKGFQAPHVPKYNFLRRIIMTNKEPKKQTGLRLRESTIDYIIDYKETHHLSSMTKAAEMIFDEHRAASMNQNEDIANRVIEKFESKYGNALTRIRIGTNAADINIQILMEIINSFAVNNAFDIGEFVSIATMKAPVLEQAEHTTKTKIAYYKQLKDNKKKKNDTDK